MKNFKVTKERMIMIFSEHGMTTADFWDFYNQYGSNGPYFIKDVRAFLGY